MFTALQKHLDGGNLARTFACDEDDAALIATSDLLTLKPVIYAANTDEAGFADLEHNQYYQQVKAIADAEGSQVLPICAKMEQDIAELEGEEKLMFLEELGVEESGLDRLIKCSYALLGLISFLTYGKDECRAWTIKKGTKAPQAAGKIHSDIERGFIRAEVIAYEDMIACGSVNAAKEKGPAPQRGQGVCGSGRRHGLLPVQRMMTEAERLAAYDRMYADLLKERDKVLADMDKLRAAGRNRGTTYQQLLAQKLTVQNLIGRFEIYGIKEV